MNAAPLSGLMLACVTISVAEEEKPSDAIKYAELLPCNSNTLPWFALLTMLAVLGPEAAKLAALELAATQERLRHAYRKRIDDLRDRSPRLKE